MRSALRSFGATDPQRPGPHAVLHDFLVEHLQVTCGAIARDDYDRYVLGGAAGLAQTLRLLDGVGQEIAEADLDDLQALLGTRHADGNRPLAEHLADQPDRDLPDRLRVWHRMAVRREFSWRPADGRPGLGQPRAASLNRHA